MKILHLTNNLGSGGAEKLLTDILPQFAAKGHTVEVAISSSKTSVPKYHEILQQHGVAITDFATSYYNPLQVFRLVRLIRKRKFDIVHAHLFPTQYWLAFASLFFPKSVKLVKTEHSVFNERKDYKILRPLEKFVYSRYQAIIAITEIVEENLVSWIGMAEKMAVIKNGVNLDQIESEKQKAKLSDYEFLKPQNFNIFMVGRFDFSQKDQLSLIRAVATLPDNVHLFFAGKGPNEENVKKAVIELKLDSRVHFLGVRTDVYRLMSLVDLNVLSTNHEGLSGVALESLASGKPFLGSDVVGVHDVVPAAEFLFPKQNPEKLASKISEVIQDAALRERLASLALEHVKAFDTPIMARQYLEIYHKLHGQTV